MKFTLSSTLYSIIILYTSVLKIILLYSKIFGNYCKEIYLKSYRNSLK